MQSLRNKDFENVLAKNIAPRKVCESLVDNEYMSDVILVLANGEELRAHKIFLATSGLFFYKLFAEHEDDVIRINLEWISKPTMLEVCRFIYADILNINDATMMDIWSVAIKMQMKYLVEKATDFICKTLNEKNVFNVLQTNMKHKDFRLNMKCFEYIQKNYGECLESDEFLQLPLDLLKTMLQTFKLPNKIAKEAVIKWGNNNSHEDIEELLIWLSLNEESEAFEEKPLKPQNCNLYNHNPNQQLGTMQYFTFNGPMSIRDFRESNLVLKIKSKDMIVKKIHFIGVLPTDKEITITIYESSKLIIEEFIEDVKIDGDIFPYIPNKKLLLKANSSYTISILFDVYRKRQAYNFYNSVPNDRLYWHEEDGCFENTISRIFYEDVARVKGFGKFGKK